MKRVFNKITVLILCLITIVFSGSVVAMAADESIGVASNISVTSVGATSVSVQWSAISGVKGYVLYRKTADSDWKEVDKTSGTSLTDKSAGAGTVYYYAVRGYTLQKGLFGIDKTDRDKNRNYGDYSATVKAITKPAKVTGLKTTALSATRATLAWNTIAGANAYQVYMLDNATGKYKRIANTANNKYTVRNLKALTEYKFKVRAYHKLKGVVYGEFSAEFSVKTKPADVVDFRVSKSTGTEYELSWAADDSIAGFQLAQYNNDEKEWKIILNETKETTYSVSGLSYGGYGKYKIRAYVLDNSNKKVYGNWSEEIVAGTLPKAPVNLKLAANTDNGISITWDYMDGAAGYEVYCRENDGNWYSVGITHNNHFSHPNLTEKRKYEYKVRAFVGADDHKIYGNFGEVISMSYTPIEIPDSPYDPSWDSTGILGYLYDPDEQCFYTSDDPWQRNFGYNEIYDQSASLVAIIIETCRLKFPYDNKDWMIQLWKGQYGFVLYGAEIGIYNKPDSREIEHYDCATDEDMLQMEMTLYEKKTETLTGITYWDKTFSRPYERQWWHTGFVWGNVMTRYDDDLRLYARITMRDYAMLAECEKAFRNEGFEKPDITNILEIVKKEGNYYYTNGLDICFFWT